MELKVSPSLDSLVIFGNETEIYALTAWINKHSLRLATPNIDRMLPKDAQFIPLEGIIILEENADEIKSLNSKSY